MFRSEPFGGACRKPGCLRSKSQRGGAEGRCISAPATSCSQQGGRHAVFSRAPSGLRPCDAAQSLDGADFEKWILVFPAGEQTFLCVAAYLSTQKEAFRSLLRDSLLSISYDAAALVANAAIFHVDVTGLTLAHRISRTEMYTADGKVQQASPASPLFVVGPSIAKISPSDRQTFSERRLYQTAHTTIGQVASHSALVVDGLAGYETVASATDTSSGTPMTLYQVMLFAEDHYFIIQGLVGRDQSSVYLPRFKQAARSFRREAH